MKQLNKKVELEENEVDWICKMLGNLSKLYDNPHVTLIFDNESYIRLQSCKEEIEKKRLELMRKIGYPF